MEKQFFYNGEMFDAYNYLGAHIKGDSVQFTTYAPNALKVSIVGDFNNWQEEFMTQEEQNGFFSFTSNLAKTNQMYKYKIYSQDGSYVEHCDPYGFGMELRPGCCSIIRDLSEYKFQDEKWMKDREDSTNKPVNIYELHLGSWMKKSDIETDWYQYDEIADILIPYILKNHYTHIQFMPLTEHPFDGSWGYQNTGFYAPTSRYGTATQLKYLIDKLHQSGIGAIMDFTPAQFAVDSYGLKTYDGTYLYDCNSDDINKNVWGSYNFNYSSKDVQSFLQSSANYWLTEYHFDGLKFDAINNVIYWQGDDRKGVNSDAILFLKKMNKGLKDLHPNVMLIAENSSNFKGITASTDENGLGFDYVCNLEWMHDTLEYLQISPEYRTRDYHKLISPMMNFEKEKYLLPFSHNEVVHGKATILQKMYGDYKDKFPQARAMYLYMMMHPGKKLNFMGNEIGQFREWDEQREQDWDLLKYPNHDSFNKYITELNSTYLKHNVLYDDYSSNFYWADCSQEEKCIYALARKSNNETLISIINFSDITQDYTLNLEDKGRCQLILNTDNECWGGSTPKGKEKRRVIKRDTQQVLNVSIPRYSGMLFSVQSPSNQNQHNKHMNTNTSKPKNKKYKNKNSKR